MPPPHVRSLRLPPTIQAVERSSRWVGIAGSIVVLTVMWVVWGDRGPTTPTQTSAQPREPTTTSGLTATTPGATPATTLPVDAVRVSVGAQFSELYDASPEGTTYLFEPGVHRGVSVIPRDGDVFLGMDGAVLSGESELEFAIFSHDVEAPVSGVVVRGLVIERYATPAQLGTLGGGGTVDWLIEDNEIRYNGGAGVELGERMVVRGNHIHHNEQLGIHAGYVVSGALIEANEISQNNHLELYDVAWEAGGAKLLHTTDLVVRNNLVHSNHGPGLWTDADNVGTIYEGNTVRDNYGPGIFHEISYSAVIRDNVVEGNGHGFYLGGILVADSSDVEVYGNQLSGNNGGVVGIYDDRGMGTHGPYQLRNLWVHDNVISYETGVTGIIRNAGSRDVFRSWDNRFDQNTYQIPHRGRPYHWGGGTRTRDRWVDYGQDVNSTWR